MLCPGNPSAMLLCLCCVHANLLMCSRYSYIMHMLFSCYAHAILTMPVLFLCCAHAILVLWACYSSARPTLCSRTVFTCLCFVRWCYSYAMLPWCCAHALLMLCPCYSHPMPMLVLCYAHAILIHAAHCSTRRYSSCKWWSHVGHSQHWLVQRVTGRSELINRHNLTRRAVAWRVKTPRRGIADSSGPMGSLAWPP